VGSLPVRLVTPVALPPEQAEQLSLC
jgi:hypothetical protein